MTSHQDVIQQPEPLSSPNLFGIWAVFAVTDGLLMLATSAWHPLLASFLYPWLAFIASCAALAYSGQSKWLWSRISSSLPPVRSVAIATLSGSITVLVLRNVGYARLSIPHGPIIVEVAFVLSITVLVPLGEELVFRGIILEKLLGEERILVAIAMSAMAAAICHDGFILAFIEHAVISGVYIACGRSLGAAVIAHAVLNTSAMIPGLARPLW